MINSRTPSDGFTRTPSDGSDGSVLSVVNFPAIDLLTGSSVVKQAIERHLPLQEILERVGDPPTSFTKQVRPYLLY